MKKTQGFTIIELIIACAVISIFLAIFGSAIAGFIFNNAGKTEDSAYAAAEKFITTNNLDVKRKTCAHDSDGDGQATCTIALNDGEKIFLSCPVGIFNTFMGAESCKEIDTLLQMGIKRR